MSVGLIALLDDVAAIAKVAASSLDDVAGAAAKAGAKSAGVVIDDAAVTPRYVVGFSADREIPIVAKIAKGSLRNKLLILLPVALALSFLAPWAVTPLLMFGAAFLCYEGAEKVYEAVRPHDAHAHEAKLHEALTPEQLEEARVSGAIRTDFILSAEIMAIALSTVASSGIVTQALVLATVAVFITAGVYGVVALIVKADDLGVRLAATEGDASGARLTRAVGRGLVRGMPPLLAGLSVVGTAAMIWVGGGIIVHGLAAYGLEEVEHLIHGAADTVGHAVPGISGVLAWVVTAAASGVVGLALGFALIPLVGSVVAPAWKRLRSAVA